jgi:hypothetical protein
MINHFSIDHLTLTVSQVHIHCYETVDLDDIVRVCRCWLCVYRTAHISVQLSNEFEFPIAAFHHAHEAYLVPDVLKRAYGQSTFS